MDNLWIWLVVEPYASEKYESIVMMTFPTEWKNKVHVPNHQADIQCATRKLLPGCFLATFWGNEQLIPLDSERFPNVPRQTQNMGSSWFV